MLYRRFFFRKMDQIQPLLDNINRFIQLPKEDENALLSIITIKKIKKRKFIIKPGYVCRSRSYILEGAFRVFYIDDLGKEHTVSIGVEDWFVTDFYSYINQTPAENYAEAIEDSTILQMQYEDIETLCGQSHALSEYFRLTTEKAFAYSRKRVISNISKTAEERYDEYAIKYPNIINRVPQYVLASYLGMSQEFLSKIRKQKSRK